MFPFPVNKDKLTLMTLRICMHNHHAKDAPGTQCFAMHKCIRGIIHLCPLITITTASRLIVLLFASSPFLAEFQMIINV